MTGRVVQLAAPRVSLCGGAALLLDAEGALSLPTQERIWSLAEETSQWPGIVDVQPGMNSLLVVLDPLDGDPDAVSARLLDTWARTPPGRPAGRTLELGLVYGGEWGQDLDHVATHLGLTPGRVAALHAGADYTVFAPGIGPGFGYLFGLDPALFIPRRERPVLRPDDGSVTIAGAQALLRGPRRPGTAGTMMTGWYTIGRVPDVPVPFDLASAACNLLALGDRIRFRIAKIEA